MRESKEKNESSNKVKYFQKQKFGKWPSVTTFTKYQNINFNVILKKTSKKKFIQKKESNNKYWGICVCHILAKNMILQLVEEN